MARGNADNLIPNSERSPEELREMTRKGGIASGKARREKADMRRLMQAALEGNIPGKELSYAQRLTQSMLTIAGNPKQGAAAVRAYETILHIIGQDEPEVSVDTMTMLKEILKENRERARIQAESETE